MMCGNNQFTEPVTKLALDNHIWPHRIGIHDNEHIGRPDLHIWSIPSRAIEFGGLGIDLAREKLVISNQHRRTGYQGQSGTHA